MPSTNCLCIAKRFQRNGLVDMYLEESFIGGGVWLVQLLGTGMDDGIYSFTDYNNRGRLNRASGFAYRWKVYESTGNVEQIDVDMDY